MNMKSISYCLLAGLLFGACSGNVYEETDKGVIVKVQQKGDMLKRNLPTGKVWLLFLKRSRLPLR